MLSNITMYAFNAAVGITNGVHHVARTAEGAMDFVCENTGAVGSGIAEASGAFCAGFSFAQHVNSVENRPAPYLTRDGVQTTLAREARSLAANASTVVAK